MFMTVFMRLLGAWSLGVWAEPRHVGVSRGGMFAWGGRFGVGPVTVGAGHVDDDALVLVVARVCFAGDSAVGVEELVGDVGEHGGAAWGDAAFGDESEKAGEELVDVDAGVEFGEGRE